MGKGDEQSKTIGEYPPSIYFIVDLSYLLMNWETFEGIESTYFLEPLLEPLTDLRL